MEEREGERINIDQENEILFSDLFELEDLQGLQDLFAETNGVASVITTIDGVPITQPSNFTRFCSKVIRKTEEGCANCYKSDAILGRHHPEGPIVRPCLSGGLWDAGASITVGGKHIASWLIGQVRNDEVNEQSMLQYADEIGANRIEFMQALNEVPIMSVEKFQNISKLLFAFVNELSEKAYSNAQLKIQKEKLHESEQTLQYVLQGSQLGYWDWNLQTGEVKRNDRWAEMLGYKIDDIEFSVKQWIDFVHPEDREMALKSINDQLAGLSPMHRIEYRMQTKQGAYIWVLDQAQAVKWDNEGKVIRMSGTHTDVNVRKLAEIELNYEQHFTKVLLDSLPGIFYLYTYPELKLVRWNKNHETIFGYSPEEFSGMSVRNWRNNDAKESILIAMEEIISRGDLTFETFLYTKGYEAIPFILSAIRFESKGKTYIMGVGFDNTIRKKAERDLLQAKYRAEDSDRIKTAFLQNMSHEIRTPMNSIMGFASLLSEEEEKTTVNSYSDIIYKNAEQLLHVIDDIVLYSQLQNRQFTFIPKEFDVNLLIDDIKQSFNLPEYKNGVELKTELLANNPLTIYSDYDKIRQVLTNLVSNAFKYTFNGTVTLGIYSNENEQLFFVKDTGMGIPSDEIKHIFDRFYRANNAKKGLISGTGLGLSIVKELVDLLKGKIWVESDEGKGSCFYFSLPVL
ncbi:MAG: PocR ligand-binding domain-containing protein [Prolixibacteraceae bacterium]